MFEPVTGVVLLAGNNVAEIELGRAHVSHTHVQIVLNALRILRREGLVEWERFDLQEVPDCPEGCVRVREEITVSLPRNDC